MSERVESDPKFMLRHGCGGLRLPSMLSMPSKWTLAGAEVAGVEDDAIAVVVP